VGGINYRIREGAIAPHSESGYVKRWIGWIWTRLGNIKNSAANISNQADRETAVERENNSHLKKENSCLVKRQVESKTVRCTFRLPESSSFRLTVNQIECIYLIIHFGVKGKKEILLKEKGRRKVVLLTEMNATRKIVFLARLSVAGERKTFDKKRKDG
jgi:hypothetical protein